jgi:NADH:ubiquinone oxidoreductase subunit 3 (subunit A)
VYKLFKQIHRQRYGFYECGFKARIEKSTLVQLHNVLIIAMVLLYDVEGLVLLFFILNSFSMTLFEIILISFYIILLMVGYFFDTQRNNVE